MAVVKGAPGQSRRQRARETRQRIVRAAVEEFQAGGYHGTTMATIAARAGVAVQTVYFIFHTKAELLSAAVDAAVMGDDDPRIPQRTDWYRAMTREPDASRALRGFIQGASDVIARAAPLTVVARDAAAADPEALRVREHHEGRRSAEFRDVVVLMADKGGLREGLNVDSANDILLTLLGPDTDLAFVRDRGWSHERFVAWLSESLPELLLAPPARRGRRPTKTRRPP
jgi:AcrR family transcriptional regulator